MSSDTAPNSATCQLIATAILPARSRTRGQADDSSTLHEEYKRQNDRQIRRPTSHLWWRLELPGRPLLEAGIISETRDFASADAFSRRTFHAPRSTVSTI